MLRFIFNPLPDDIILDWSKLKQFADDNFEFDVNSRKFYKLVENTVGKGEIARYEQFLLFPQCFQKACLPGASKVSLCGNGLNGYGMWEKKEETLVTSILLFSHNVFNCLIS